MWVLSHLRKAIKAILDRSIAVVRQILLRAPKQTPKVTQKVTKDRKRVVIFGSSANPPTGFGGHAGIVKRLSEEFDEVWVLPVYKHIYDSKRNLAPFEHRMQMCRLAFKDAAGERANVFVKDIERTVVTNAVNEGRSAGSIDVLRHIQGQHLIAGIDWYWALGMDTYRDLRAGKWKDGDEFQKRVTVVVIPREGEEEIESGVKYKLSIPSLTRISSTSVRATTDNTILSQALHPDVLEYIQVHKLYEYSNQ